MTGYITHQISTIPDCSVTLIRLISSKKPHTHSELALAKKPQLVVPSALLSFQLQDFGLKDFFSGDSLVFYLADLKTSGKNFKILNIVTHITSGNTEDSMFITASAINICGLRKYS